MKTLRWGIVGLGRIAHLFTQDLQLLQNHEIVAVASRSSEKAQAFAQKYGVKTSYGSYQALFQDANVDIVYVATPHNSHASLSIAAMKAKKHVLCEKPLAINTTQVMQMVETAREQQVFLMEAFWSRFNPSIQEVLSLVQKGAIGEVNYLNADFTFFIEPSENDRMISLETAGGSLLEMGVYPVFLAYLLFGMPTQILATSRKYACGSDLQTAILLKYPEGIANLMSGYASQSDMVARICGTEGRILLEANWHETQGFKLVKGEHENTFHLPTKGRGFTYEIEECYHSIQHQQLESTRWPHQATLDLFSILDEVRQQIGLTYPMETTHNTSTHEFSN